MMKLYAILLSVLMVTPLYAAAPAARASRCPRGIECTTRGVALGALFAGVLGTAVVSGIAGYSIGGGYVSPSRTIAVVPCGSCQLVYSANVCQPSSQGSDSSVLDEIKTFCKNPNPVIFDVGTFASGSCISLDDVAAQFKSQCPANTTGSSVKPSLKKIMHSKRKLMADRRAGKIV